MHSQRGGGTVSKRGIFWRILCSLEPTTGWEVSYFYWGVRFLQANQEMPLGQPWGHHVALEQHYKILGEVRNARPRDLRKSTHTPHFPSYMWFLTCIWVGLLLKFNGFLYGVWGPPAIPTHQRSPQCVHMECYKQKHCIVIKPDGNEIVRLKRFHHICHVVMLYWVVKAIISANQ